VMTRPLGTDEICGVFAGLRPLVGAEGAADTTRLSRRHRLFQPLPGLTAIAGGKYTTYRVMARDAVDAAVPGAPASPTDRLPLLGAGGDVTSDAPPGVDAAQVQRLIQRHGSCAGEVLALIAEDPGLAAPLPGAPQYLAAEAVHACAYQGALDLDDVLSRRTRAAIESADRGREAAAFVAPLVAAVLGWSDERAAHEVQRYRRLRDAEQAAESAPDDRSALEAYRAVLDQARAPGP